MPTLSYRIHQSALRSIQFCVPGMLRPAGWQNPARQAQGGNDAGNHSQVQGLPSTIRDHWFAERQWLGTPLSPAELRHGVNAGIISATLLSNDGTH